MTLAEFDWDDLPSGISSRDYSSGTISTSNPYNSTERQTMATEIMKGMVNSGLVEEPEDMAKEAVRLTDALLAELRK